MDNGTKTKKKLKPVIMEYGHFPTNGEGRVYWINIRSKSGRRILRSEKFKSKQTPFSEDVMTKMIDNTRENLNAEGYEISHYELHRSNALYLPK